MKDKLTFLIGGKAGEGVKKAGSVITELFSDKGWHVFEMDDYQSLIKGGHNFAVVTVSKEPVYSHYKFADIIVSLDKRSYDLHRGNISSEGVHFVNDDKLEDFDGIGIPISSHAKEFKHAGLLPGIASVTLICTALGMDLDDIKKLIKDQYSHYYEENSSYAEKIFNACSNEGSGVFEITDMKKHYKTATGNQAIALGAVAGGLDLYYAYPMTPASSILHYLASMSDKLSIRTIHPESEIAVINMAIGSTMTGAKVMAGTSGGGLALMEEGISLAGMSESPLMLVMSSRPGPSTGVPTYTSQGDLSFALNQGHGEFPMIVSSPGTFAQAFYLSAEMLSLVWKFQTPGILLTEKHLSESTGTVEFDPEKAERADFEDFKGENYSRYTVTDSGVSQLKFPPSTDMIKWNSYEHTADGITTEDPAGIKIMADKRIRKKQTIEDYLKGMDTVERYGKTGPVVITYGSTFMSVIEALHNEGIKARIIQVKYLKPFPVWEMDDIEDNDFIVVEQSAEGQFTELIHEKTGKRPRETIKRYDGRPFTPEELGSQLKEVFNG